VHYVNVVLTSELYNWQQNFEMKFMEHLVKFSYLYLSIKNHIIDSCSCLQVSFIAVKCKSVFLSSVPHEKLSRRQFLHFFYKASIILRIMFSKFYAGKGLYISIAM